MDFFARQDAARRGTRVLIVLFAFAMAAMAALVHVAVATASSLLGGPSGDEGLEAPALALIALIWTTVLFGAFFRALDVRAGGAALARRFGAEPVPADTRDERARALSHLVVEMAIAANVRPPALWLLPAERGINAFVVGAGERAVLVVSRGALESLATEELRGVVAHEIAHVLQGDLPLNMRLLIALGGLAALDEVGRLLIGPASGPRLHPAALVGWPLRALGGIGVLAGGLIRSAVSRGREHLADATAAQLTRAPSALASALVTIRDAATTPRDAPLATPYAEELAHLCFHGGRGRTWYRRALAAHPPLQSRIDALDPHADVKRRKREGHERDENPSERGRRERGASGGTAAVGTVGTGGGEPFPAGDEAPGGTDNEESVAGGPVVVPDRVALLLADGIDCAAALCALFAGRGDAYLARLGDAFDERLAERTRSLGTVLRAELEGARLAVIEHACEVLRRIADEKSRRHLLLELETVLAGEDGLDLGDYATLRLLRRRLDVEFPVLARRTETARVRSFESMGEQFALLLSLLVESSGAPSAAQAREYERVLRCYTGASLPRRHRAEPGIVAELERAFRILSVQPRAVRQAFVQHCTEIVEADGRVTPAERTLLDLVAAALDDETAPAMAA